VNGHSSWNFHYPTTRTVDTHMLRLKLEKEPDDPVRFQTVHGIGYKLVGCEAHPALAHSM
jgi:DNA-binding response OmpR family regulator